MYNQGPKRGEKKKDRCNFLHKHKNFPKFDEKHDIQIQNAHWTRLVHTPGSSTQYSNTAESQGIKKNFKQQEEEKNFISLLYNPYPL